MQAGHEHGSEESCQPPSPRGGLATGHPSSICRVPAQRASLVLAKATLLPGQLWQQWGLVIVPAALQCHQLEAKGAAVSHVLPVPQEGKVQSHAEILWAPLLQVGNSHWNSHCNSLCNSRCDFQCNSQNIFQFNFHCDCNSLCNSQCTSRCDSHCNSQCNFHFDSHSDSPHFPVHFSL